jgi:hypothetical protein
VKSSNKPFDLSGKGAIPAPTPGPVENTTIKVEVSIEPRRRIDLRKLHDDKFFVSQSDMKNVIKKGEEIPHCPKKVMEIVLIKDYPRIPATDSMKAGSFFETLCLGSGAKGEMTLDLERKLPSSKKLREWVASGNKEKDFVRDKTIAQERIEIQAERFHMLCKQLGIILTEHNIQVPIIKHLWGNEFLIGELDMFPVIVQTPDKGKRRSIIDLKLTGDIHHKHGDYCWGEPKFMDHTQADAYLELIKDIDLDLNPHLIPLMSEYPRLQQQIQNGDFTFYYWVFGYKKEPLDEQNKFVERVYDNMKRRELLEAIRKYIAIIKSYCSYTPETLPINPTFDMCKDCPINIAGDCTASINTQTV